jgi:membrane fusion protein (multidrug efflux system)
VDVDFEYVGQVAGSREVEVRAQVTGIVKQRLYREGSRVAAGQVLFKIDPATFQAQVNVAEADLAQAQARERQAKRELDRFQQLGQRKVVSPKEVDDAGSGYDLAQAAVQSAQARLATARIELAYTDVKAPIAGAAGRALKVEGSLANAQGDSLLTTIAQTDPIDVNFGVAEADQRARKAERAAGTLVLPKDGFTVRLRSSDGASLGPVGTIDFEDYKADLATGSFALRARFPNADGSLAPGQFVKVVLVGARRPSAIAIPQRAVLDAPAGKFVYVVGAGKSGSVAEPRPVEVGEWVHLSGGEKDGWVIRKGLNAGDKVIVDGTARIFFPFAPVNPSPLGSVPSAPASSTSSIPPAKTGP